jgi:4-hydroxy-tetrahydrodipicolinate reductase
LLKNKYMRIAIIGYGRMGKNIEQMALSRGHSISCIVSSDTKDSIEDVVPENTDVAVEFSEPESAFSNIEALLSNKVRVVSGTTGWTKKLASLIEVAKRENTGFFYASNFSYSLFMFNEVQKLLATQMNGFPSYEIKLQEIHHTGKKDSPSGTAITLAEGLLNRIDRKESWALGTEVDSSQIAIESIRQPNIPGTHKIKYTSALDEIELIHTAKSRNAFVEGAVDACEFMLGKTGFFQMHDLVKTKL